MATPIIHPITGAVTRFDGEYQFLSNFWRCSIIGPGGLNYPSVEHAYQASKTSDERSWPRIRDLVSPGEAKAQGNRLQLLPDWNSLRDAVMLELVRQKLTRHLSLRSKLVASHPRELIQGNYWGDHYWGVCKTGQNVLGQVLMMVRDEIIDA